MSRVVTTLAVLVLVACGGQEGGGGETASADRADAVQAGEAAGALADVASQAAGPIDIATEIASCLELVRESRFSEAVLECTKAVENAPDSTEARDALEQAQRESASAGAQETAGEVGDAAAEALGQGLESPPADQQQ